MRKGPLYQQHGRHVCNPTAALSEQRMLSTILLLSRVDPSFRALSGQLMFTVRRQKFNKDSLVVLQPILRAW